MQRAQKLLLDASPGLDLLEDAVRHYSKPALYAPLRRLLPSSTITSIDGYDHILELHGKAGAGKTHLLYLLCINALVDGKSVVVVDADGKFDCARLLHLLEKRIEGVASDALYLLDFVQVLQPQSAREVVEVLERLPVALSMDGLADDDLNTIDGLSDMGFKSRAIGLLALDSISAFHWHDPAMTLPIHTAMSKACCRLAVQGICTSWDVAYTYLALPKSTSARLLVERKEVLQFAQGITQAYATADARQEVLARGTIYVKSADGGKRTVFAIKPDGVTLQQ